MDKYGIRPGVAKDVPFLMRRTLQDMRNSDFARTVPNDLFYTYMHRALEWHMTQSVVRVAYPLPQSVASGVRSSDTKRIVGFIIAEPTNLGIFIHYLYTRRSVDDESGRQVDNYRRQGIGRMLVESIIKDFELPESPITYTFRTAMFFYDMGFRQYVDRNERFRYNPFFFFTRLPVHWETGVRRAPSHEPVELHVG